MTDLDGKAATKLKQIREVGRSLRIRLYRDLARTVMTIVRMKSIEVFVEGARRGCGLPFPKGRSARSLTRLFTTSELQTSSHLTATIVHNASLISSIHIPLRFAIDVLLLIFPTTSC